jgi:hypothetical protein
MRLLRAIALTVLVLVASIGGAVYILVNHSVAQIALTCTGSWVRGAQGVQGKPETVVAVIEEYRPWIMWSDSDGNVRAESREIPIAVYYPHIRRIGDEPIATYQFSQESDGPVVGGYRGAFGELTLQFAKGTVFDGVCV